MWEILKTACVDPPPRRTTVTWAEFLRSQAELLDRTLIWNQAHLTHALREYERHYNEHRPH